MKDSVSYVEIMDTVKRMTRAEAPSQSATVRLDAVSHYSPVSRKHQPKLRVLEKWEGALPDAIAGFLACLWTNHV